MTSVGGPRAGAGRPPDPDALRPNSLRRNQPSNLANWTHLPGPREGDPPAWPLIRATGREKSIWALEWRRPQAVMWERNGMEREVALYVRTLALAERTKAPMVSRTLVRQYMETLGISGDGLRRNRWIIDPPGQPTPAEHAEPAPEVADSRDRLKLVAS